ncbi:MAG: hypothetical protein LBT00_14060, partial [Spirochaetaceae bacterium]|nr:hypothetical protein [Spirochaetaceae bacterium]
SRERPYHHLSDPTFPPPLTTHPRHCERSEAIQREGLPRLDCFTLWARNDNALPSLRAKRGNPVRGPSPSGLLHQRQLCCRGFAMTTLSRHCERSEAIQREGLPRLDCFAAKGNHVAADSQ